MKNTREHNIDYHIRMLSAAIDALQEMKETPDTPTDVSHIAVGALGVLQKSADTKVFFSHDSVFALMDILPETHDRRLARQIAAIRSQISPE